MIYGNEMNWGWYTNSTPTIKIVNHILKITPTYYDYEQLGYVHTFEKLGLLETRWLKIFAVVRAMLLVLSKLLEQFIDRGPLLLTEFLVGEGEVLETTIYKFICVLKKRV